MTLLSNIPINPSVLSADGGFYEKIHGIFSATIEYLILATELVGVVVLVFAVAKAVIELLSKKEFARLDLAEGIALALEFKMGGELLRTVIVREWNEILILGAVILLRAALAFLIQWEIRIEKQNHREKQSDTTSDNNSVQDGK